MKNKSILYVVVIVAIVILSVGITYAAYTFSEIGKENNINTGVINFNYVEDDDALQVVNPSRINDDDAKVSDKYFEFTVSANATGKVDVGYYIYITTDSSNSSSLNNVVKYYLTSVNGTTETLVAGPTFIANTTPFNVETLAYNASSQNRLIHSGYYSFNNDNTTKSTTYRYRMWADSSYFDNAYNVTENKGSHQITLNSAIYKVKINVLGIDGQPITIK